MHKGAKIGIATVCTVMLGVGGYGVYNIATAVTGGSSAPQTPKARTVVAEPPSAEQATAGAKAFLEAWSRGDLEAAAALTDKPDAAVATLTAFKTKVGPSAITLVPGGPATPSAAPSVSPSASPSVSPASAPSATASATPPPANQVSLGFKAKVEFADTGSAWNYDGVLGLVKMSDGKALVHWTPSVIHPLLTSGESIAVQSVSAQPTSVADRNGTPLKGFASLDPLLGSFKAQATGTPGDAGKGVVITDDSGRKPAQRLFTIKEPKPAPPLKLTIDAALQTAAEKAVQKESDRGAHPASIVAIEPSSGNILAIANAPSSGYNRAFLGGIAPGSTMKVITAAALLESGIGKDSTMACPANYVVGQSFKNDFSGDHNDWSFALDFAKSCNTAFIKQGMASLKGSEQQDIARSVFGIGPAWSTGLPLAPARVPAPANNDQRAAQLIGQGSITMNSLTMASVAATVQNGTFHQPILIPGAKQLTADRTLSSGTLQALRQMMKLAVSSGTASAIDGIPGDAGAKTGTAQVDGKPDNSWFTSFRGDLAVAAEVEGGGHGAQAAGPAAAMLLQIGNGN